MSDITAISWCDRTWSPWEGCQKVGPGCDHCYAEARNQRFAAGANWGPGAPRRRTVDWKRPLLWNAQAQREGRRHRVFPSLCDPFDNAVDPAWRTALFALIASTPNLDWLLLTKRIGNAADMVAEAVRSFSNSPDGDHFLWQHPWPWPNVAIGATIVNQAEADRDVPKLLMVPARTRFVSIEPMLGPVNLRSISLGECGFDPAADAPPEWKSMKTIRFFMDALAHSSRRPTPRSGIDWVIAGGESGPRARPAHSDWFRSLRDQCAAAEVPFHFKQWGTWVPCETEVAADGRRYVYPDDGCGFDLFDHDRIATCQLTDGQEMARAGARSGRLLDGRVHLAFPEALR